MSANSNEKIGPVVLLIVDGWGIAPAGEGNALTQAGMPNFKELVSKYPSTTLKTILGKEPVKKKINISKNYASLGTGKIKPGSKSLGLFDVFNNAGVNWLVITGAEKFAYCSYFFSGLKKIKKENYLLISSELIDNYSLKPEMASPKIAEALLKKIKSRKHAFILTDFANLDMVAHSGNFSATIEAAKTIDKLLKIIAKTVLENSGVLLLTSSNGNAEEAIEMKTETNNKEDNANPVPFLIVGRQFEGKTFGFEEAPGSDLALVAPGGSLADVMPTILKIMGMDIPKNLNGRSLI
jgi:2,3-bisphosphoglycerate-independent phosphoglycerate mutase